MVNLKVLAVALMVANAMIAFALSAQVQGFDVAPAARFYLGLAAAGIGVALLFLPRPSESSELPPRG